MAHEMIYMIEENTLEKLRIFALRESSREARLEHRQRMCLLFERMEDIKTVSVDKDGRLGIAYLCVEDDI